MARGRRCALGCQSWPLSDDYKACPSCGEETKVYRNLNILDDDEARSIKLHIEFEDYYAERQAAKGLTVE